MDQSEPTPHPPKPRLTVRLGITGHRPNKLPAAAVPRIERQLGDVYAVIGRAVATILANNNSFYAPEPAAIRLICGMAEGADQMAVAACLPGWQIEAILPFPRQEYLRDFEHSASDGRDVRDALLANLGKATIVTELPPPNPDDRDQGYANAGGYMLRQIDVLIAVWDGKPPRPGGTGAIAREACAAGIPVVWLATETDAAPRLITHIAGDGTPLADDKDCTKTALTAALAPTFDAPAADADASHSARAGLGRYLAEHWTPRCSFTAYDALARIANRQWPRLAVAFTPMERRTGEWDAFLNAAPRAQDLTKRITEVLRPRYFWADTLALYYAHLYRSTYVFAYFLSAVAVFIALGTVFIHDDPHAPAREVLATKAVFVGCELIVIGAIILIIWLGRRLLWHERWLTYRALAEMLRHGRFLAFVSEFGRVQADAHAPEGRRLPWMLWYIRATMREIGLPTAVLDADYRQRILNATLADEIAGPSGQLIHHRGNRVRLHRIDHFLHRLGTGCFTVTALILITFLLLIGVDHLVALPLLEAALLEIKPFVTFLSAGLPALGAAVAGIRVHGDFEASIERSTHMVDLLSALAEDYAKAGKHGADLDDTAELLIATARVMSEDLAAWQDLYGRKRLALPA